MVAACFYKHCWLQIKMHVGRDVGSQISGICVWECRFM